MVASITDWMHMSERARILIIDDEEEICISLSKLLEAKGFAAYSTGDARQTGRLIEKHKIELVLLDINLPEKDGIHVLTEIRNGYPLLPVIMISGFGSIENVLKSMRLGAVNFYEKPINMPNLISEIDTLISTKRCRRRIATATKIVTENKEMLHILDLVNKYASTNAPVIITGETGTGKELIADAFHQSSKRADMPFIKINCAAIPDTLLESELFGYEKGAFTGANELKKGKLELADGGTIFLDEIGDMSLSTQAKILRVIEEKQTTRVGGLRNIPADCRIIAATNKDLKELIQKREFREDLFYRLSVITLKLPPLRDRPEDILLLAQSFLTYFSSLYGKRIDSFSDEVRSILFNHDWPGNVRELKNFIERAVIFSETSTLQIDNYSLICKLPDGGRPSNPRNLTKGMILDALNKCNGNKKETSTILNISRTTLYNKIEEFGIG
jgi:two-component system response regulator AtoC